MRRFAFLVLLASSALLAAPLYTSVVTESQACTTGTCARAAAPTSIAEGMSLYGVDGYRLTVCAAAGNTLSGAGTIQMWLCDAASGLCMRNVGLDQSVTATVRCQAFPDFKASMISADGSTVVAAASGVTVSGGAALTVTLSPHVAR